MVFARSDHLNLRYGANVAKQCGIVNTETDHYDRQEDTGGPVDTRCFARYSFYKSAAAVSEGGKMDNYSIGEILEMAIQTEKLGYQFYSGMADKFKKDAGLVKLLTTLASKERVHERTFANLKETVDKNGTEPVEWEEVSNYMRAFVESEFFLGAGKSLPTMDHIRTVPDVIKFALGFEKETLLYFMELRSIVREKAVMDAVIEEEKDHIVWLDKFRKDIERAGSAYEQRSQMRMVK